MNTKHILVTIVLLLIAGFGHAAQPTTLQKKALSYAARFPLSQATTVEGLGRTLGSVSQDQYTQALTVYCWLSQNLSYDRSSYESWKVNEPMASQDPETILRRGTAVCAGYAALFTAICDEIGLSSTVITGYAKGASYQAGNHFFKTNHAWNAVMIDGNWALIDATWGDCCAQNGIPDFFYFCPEPSQLLTSHLPSDSKWQLRDYPWSLKTFESNPVSGDQYFKLEVQGYAPKAIQMNRTSAPLTIKLLHQDPSSILVWASFVPQNSKEYLHIPVHKVVNDHGMELTVDLDPTLSGTLSILAGVDWSDQHGILHYQVIGTSKIQTAMVQ